MAEFALIKQPARRGSTLTAAGSMVIALDVTESESHEQSANITSFPVEKAINITDNIRANQLTLKLNGLVTATPLHVDGEPDRIRTTHQALLDAVSSGEIFTVVTGLISYESMAIRSYSGDRNAGVGQAMAISLDLVQIRVVDEAEIATPPYILEPRKTRTGGQDRQKKGPQTGSEADGAEKAEAASALYKIKTGGSVGEALKNLRIN